MPKHYRFNYKGNLIAEKTFDEVNTLSKEYSSARKGKKMGIVKSDSLEVVVDLMYDRYENYDSISLWEIKNGKKLFKVFLDEKTLIIDEKNNVLQSYLYKNIIKEKDFIITYLNNLKGVINKNGIVLFEPRFSSCAIISKNRILGKEGKLYHIYDENGNLIKSIEAKNIRYISPDNILQVHFEKDGKNGLFDDDFNIIIENKYDEIEVVNDNLFFVRNGNETVALNRNNDVVKNFEFPFVLYKAVKLKNGNYNYVVAIDSSYQAKKGLLNDKFELVIPIENNWFEYNVDVWSVKKGSSYYLYSLDYEEINGVKYKEIGKFEPSGIACTVDNEGKYRFIDCKGKVYGDYVFDNVFMGSRSTLDRLFTSGLCGVKLNTKWGFINLKGDILIECKFEQIKEFNNDGYTYVKFNGKWGVIDVDGNILFDFIYDEILITNIYKNGIYANAKYNGKWGVIDVDGNILFDFIYNDTVYPNLENRVIRISENNQFGLEDFDKNQILPCVFDDIKFISVAIVGAVSKKSVLKKEPPQKAEKSIEPIELLEQKYLQKFDTLQHKDVVRVMILAIVTGEEDNLSNRLYIVDVIKRDLTSATFISGYEGGGCWAEYEFYNEGIYNGGDEGFNVFDYIRKDEQVQSIVADFLCEIDDELDEYQYKSLKHFTEVGKEDLKVLNAVWYEKGFDYSAISKNDKKRFSKLLKQSSGMYWQKWNFKF